MTPLRRACTVLFILLALPALRPPGAGADTLELTTPAAATCVTNDGAVYSLENGELKPVRGQFTIFPPGSQALRPRTAVSLDGAPGQLLRMYVWSGEPLDSVSIQVGAPGGPSRPPLTRSSGFRLQTWNGIELWVALVGIPAWGAEHDYTLTLSAAAGQRSYLLLQPFTVTERKFFSEKIPLTADLTTLATVPDAQKKEESRVLAEVLSTAHPDAVFEKGDLVVPLPVGRRTSGFGDRREYDYSDGTRGYSVHLGVDIASPTGTPVPASGRGRVVFADSRILTGQYRRDRAPARPVLGVLPHVIPGSAPRGRRGEGTGGRGSRDDGLCHRPSPALGGADARGLPWIPTRLVPAAAP